MCIIKISNIILGFDERGKQNSMENLNCHYGKSNQGHSQILYSFDYFTNPKGSVNSVLSQFKHSHKSHHCCFQYYVWWDLTQSPPFLLHSLRFLSKTCHTFLQHQLCVRLNGAPWIKHIFTVGIFHEYLWITRLTQQQMLLKNNNRFLPKCHVKT